MEIKIEKLSKKFDDNHVLKNINLLIKKNKSTIILGKSGCGKSVLLKLIYQLIQSDEGSISYDKKKFVDIDKFGMLFQYGALFDSLTVAENIAFIDFIDGKNNYRNKVINSLREVGLSADIYNKYPNNFYEIYHKTKDISIFQLFPYVDSDYDPQETIKEIKESINNLKTRLSNLKKINKSLNEIQNNSSALSWDELKNITFELHNDETLLK